MAKAMMNKKYEALDKYETNPTNALFVKVKSPAKRLLNSIKANTMAISEAKEMPK